MENFLVVLDKKVAIKVGQNVSISLSCQNVLNLFENFRFYLLKNIYKKDSPAQI